MDTLRLSQAHKGHAARVIAALLCALLLLTPALALGEEALVTLTPYEQELLDTINTERERQGFVPLAVDPLLQQASRIRVHESIVRFSHNRPDTTAWKTVFDQMGIHAQERAENLAQDAESPREAFYAWMKSKSHRENMLNPDYTHIGLSSTTDEKGNLYWNLLVMLPE